MIPSKVDQIICTFKYIIFKEEKFLANNLLFLIIKKKKQFLVPIQSLSGRHFDQVIENARSLDHQDFF